VKKNKKKIIKKKIKKKKYKKKIIKDNEKEIIERKKTFADVIFAMDHLIQFDREIQRAYEIINPIINLYCKEIVQYSELDKKTYEKVFNILSKKNINIKHIEVLKTIIRCQ